MSNYNVRIGDSIIIDRVREGHQRVFENGVVNKHSSRRFDGFDDEFMAPGTVHEVIEPPEGQTSHIVGVWIMGVGVPYQLMWDEFILDI